MTDKVNDQLLCICGSSGMGKSAGLKDLENPEGVLYLNTEAGKHLPFKSKFIEKTIIDPYQIYEAFDWAETQDNIHTIAIDSLVFMMNMFESIHVLPSPNTQKAWGEYAQFFIKLMGQKVAASTKNVIFTSHVSDVLNESDMVMEKLIKVKGSLMATSIEAYFSTIVSAKKMSLVKLKDFSSDLLNITEEEEMLGYKHVFQTRITKDTINERIRAPMGMWLQQETFIDNNAKLVIDRLHSYYS